MIDCVRDIAYCTNVSRGWSTATAQLLVPDRTGECVNSIRQRITYAAVISDAVDVPGAQRLSTNVKSPREPTASICPAFT